MMDWANTTTYYLGVIIIMQSSLKFDHRMALTKDKTLSKTLGAIKYILKQAPTRSPVTDSH